MNLTTSQTPYSTLKYTDSAVLAACSCDHKKYHSEELLEMLHGIGLFQ